MRAFLALTEYISDLINKGARFAAVSIDINNFKNINDTFGFDAGNQVLIEVTRRFSVYRSVTLFLPLFLDSYTALSILLNAARKVSSFFNSVTPIEHVI